ncbi:MAG: hypothetical protein Q9219_004668 [cf. Caloplaca sp. 3 TL-2023]
MDQTSSPIFTIFVGPSRKHLLAHSEVLSKSSTLWKIVNGSWKDSKNRSINLEEWEEETVEQVLNWLYFGFYSVPEMLRNQSDTVPAAEIRIDVDGHAFIEWYASSSSTAQAAWGTVYRQGSTVQRKQDHTPDEHRPLTPLHKVRCLGSCASPLSQIYPVGDSRLIRLTKSHCTEWGHSLLPDAKVYGLAQYLQSTDLKRHAFCHIQDVLIYFNRQRSLTPATLARIVALAHYVYTSTDHLVNSEEPLRKLVSTFMTEWFMRLEGSGFESLMSQGGDFAIDVTRKLRRHMQNIPEG